MIAHECQPVVAVGDASVDDVEEVALDLFGDRPPAAAADGPAFVKPMVKVRVVPGVTVVTPSSIVALRSIDA